MNKVSSRSRRMLITTRVNENHDVNLAVRDNGSGFDLQDSERLFNAFYTTKNTGMGIGLSISRSIIERHDGRLWASVNEGPGATFQFSIPQGLDRSSPACDEPLASQDLNDDERHAERDLK
jgi:signal transduction histidine kinase